MQFLEEEIIEITETTWQAMLGLDIHSKPGEAIPQEPEGLLTGRVEIHGAWAGVVLLHGSIDMARSAASIFFSLDSAPPKNKYPSGFMICRILLPGILNRCCLNPVI